MKKFELRLNDIEKVKKVFQYDDINIIIAECLADYGNSCKVEVTNVLCENI